MPGDYSDDEVISMNQEQLHAAAGRGWKKHEPTEQVNLPGSIPVPSANVWATNAEQRDQGYDFTVPSGQKCLLKRVVPEELLKLGILDRVSRLEGIAATLVLAAEGQPPVKETMPSHEDLDLLIDTINLIVPAVVLQPKIYADGVEAPDSQPLIRVSDIDLDDRVAIMNEALKGLKALDRFRQPG